MDAESMGRLAEIAVKEPAALTEEEIAFLRARRDYLSEEHRIVFASVLEPQPSTDEPAPEAEKETKKGKK